MVIDKFNAAVEPLWVFLHRGHVVRRACLGVSVVLTVRAFEWATAYADALGNPTGQHVAMVAAVVGIPSTLLATSIKFYNTGRSAPALKPGGEARA